MKDIYRITIERMNDAGMYVPLVNVVCHTEYMLAIDVPAWIIEEIDNNATVTEYELGVPLNTDATQSENNTPHATLINPMPFAEARICNDAPCGIKIWGSRHDIDSGLRKHMDTCEACTEEIERREAIADIDEKRTR
jgi:hypothetical protein